MTLTGKKHIVGVSLLSLAAVVAVAVSCTPIGRSTSSRRAPIFERDGAAIAETQGQTEEITDASAVSSQQADGLALIPVDLLPVDSLPVDSLSADSLARRTGDFPADTLAQAVSTVADTLDRSYPVGDSLMSTQTDSLLTAMSGDSTAVAPASASTAPAESRPFLDAPVVGKAQDSLVYDVRRKLIFHYNQGDLTYQDNNLKADYIVVDADTREIFGTGLADTAGVVSRPDFTQGGTNYTMDTVRYNLDSKKALVQGVATQDGEGFLLGRRMKKMPDGTMNGEGLRYTTCDHIEHPHFYIQMTRAKVIPGKKIITGPAFFVMEDVPVYLLGLPGGFFPISTGPTAGLIMPKYGEEAARGFYLRGGGYYFTFGDYVDLALTGDLYTLGSWGLSAVSNYVKRYKFRGSFSTTYNKHIMGEKNSTNYRNSNTFNVTWNHSLDPKSNPRQTFSANVNFSTAGQKQLATTSLQDHLNTSTTSNVQYSRRWTVGTTDINLSTSFSLTSNSNDSSLVVTLPNVNLSVSSFAPFKRRQQIGKQRWYEKITLKYDLQAQNMTGGHPGTSRAGSNKVLESELFSKETLRNMQNGILHRASLQTSFSLLNYINFSPSFNYQESWNFKKQRQGWDPLGNDGRGAPMNTTDPNDPNYIPPEYGFFRTYDWRLAGSFSTKIYGQFEVKRRPGRTGWLQAFRHVMTPSLSFSYAPDFRHPRYGFYEHVQNNPSGSYSEYQPVQGTPRVSPGSQSASASFSLSNQLEIKVRDRRDSTGMKKITLIEQFSLSNISYNFLADSMNLSTVGVSLRTGEIFKGFALQLSGTWDPYLYVDNGMGGVRKVAKFNIGRGKFGRITNTSWSFGKTFNSPNGPSPAAGSINGQFINPYDPYNFSNNLDPATRRQYMAAGWYDFSVPWSFTFNYSVNFSYTGLKPQIRQTLGFNGSLTLTQNWGFNFNSGYDFTARKLSHMQLSLRRELHCWEMSFQWVPMGAIKNYSFHIGIKSGMLADIKYDKSSNMYDNLIR